MTRNDDPNDLLRQMRRDAAHDLFEARDELEGAHALLDKLATSPGGDRLHSRDYGPQGTLSARISRQVIPSQQAAVAAQEAARRRAAYTQRALAAEYRRLTGAPPPFAEEPYVIPARDLAGLFGSPARTVEAEAAEDISIYIALSAKLAAAMAFEYRGPPFEPVASSKHLSWSGMLPSDARIKKVVEPRQPKTPTSLGADGPNDSGDR